MTRTETSPRRRACYRRASRVELDCVELGSLSGFMAASFSLHSTLLLPAGHHECRRIWARLGPTSAIAARELKNPSVLLACARRSRLKADHRSGGQRAVRARDPPGWPLTGRGHDGPAGLTAGKSRLFASPRRHQQRGLVNPPLFDLSAIYFCYFPCVATDQGDGFRGKHLRQSPHKASPTSPAR
jgi:hypothetical protein